MKICVLGISGDQLDEGMKNFSRQLNQYLAERCETLYLDFGTSILPHNWKQISRFDPDIIHMIPGPTVKGLILLHLMGRVFDAKTVATALHPSFSSLTESFLRYVAPDLTLVQSSAIGEYLQNKGFNTSFISSGVDLEKFSPVPSSQRYSIRGEKGLPEEERIFLHVGHLKEGRNLRELTNLCDYGTVIIIGSPATEHNEELITDLEKHGCRIIDHYVENIERYYQTSDVYVFPTDDEAHSIQIPLSVLEAMACNKPVLTKRFGGLPDLFSESNGFQFVRDLSDLSEYDLNFNIDELETRTQVQDLSWESVAETVLNEYHKI